MCAGRDRLRFQPWAAGLGWGLQRTEGPKPPWVLSASACCSQLSHPWVFASPSCLRRLPINDEKEKRGALGRDSHMLEGSCTAQRGLMQVLKAALLYCCELCGEGGFKKN